MWCQHCGRLMQFMGTVGLSDIAILSCVGIGPYMGLSDGGHLKNDNDFLLRIVLNHPRSPGE